MNNIAEKNEIINKMGRSSLDSTEVHSITTTFLMFYFKCVAPCFTYALLACRFSR